MADRIWAVQGHAKSGKVTTVRQADNFEREKEQEFFKVTAAFQTSMKAERECVTQAPHLPPIWPGSIDGEDDVVRHKAIMVTPSIAQYATRGFTDPVGIAIWKARSLT